MKNRNRRIIFSLVIAAIMLCFQPVTGLTARAEGLPTGAQAEAQQTGDVAWPAGALIQDTAAQSAQEAAAAAVQAQADALMAAHLAAWQQAQEEYAAQLAAYRQALAEQQAAAQLAAQQQAEAAAQLSAQQQAAAQEAAAQAIAAAQAAAEAQTQTDGQPSQDGQNVTGAPADVPTSLAGKTVSILGDSISTYQGWIPEGYACFYPDPDNDIKDVSQTWWMQVIQNTGMSLLVNGSWSASAVCGDSRAEDSSAGCSSRRIVDLMGNTGTVPDVILVYLGANDFFASIPLGKFSGTAEYRNDHYIWDFTEGYELMLQKLQAVYPTSKIYCMTLIEANSGDHPRVNANGNTIADYNSRIKQIAAAHGISVIDVHNCGLEVYELGRFTSDGTHPNREGAAKMAAYVTNALLMGG